MIRFDDLPLKLQSRVRIKIILDTSDKKELKEYIIEVINELTKLQKALYGIKETYDN